MQLVNQTPVPAEVTVLELSPEMRGAIVTAKATFRFEAGETALETQSPLPISLMPAATELGLLPPDQPYLAGDDQLEVVVLGCAHAPGGRPVNEMRVALAVGEVRRELVVTGDRMWVSTAGQLAASAPLPFTRMPLTWERAFGGRCEVEVDAGAVMDIADQRNPHGRGFDVEPDVRAQAAFLRSPPGYPKYVYERLLPNVERPDERVTGPADKPRPACWATTPIASALRGEHVTSPDGVLSPAEAGSIASVTRSLRSACTDWVIPTPPAGAAVVLDGLTPDGPLSFPLPRLQVHADYAVGERRGRLTLRPQLVTLLPEERRLCMVYHVMLRLPYAAEEERSLRIRLQN